MQHGRSRSIRRYAEALAAALVAIALSWLLRDVLAGTRLLLLWVMSVYVAWRGGLGPVMVASLVGVLVWDILIMAPGGVISALPRSEPFAIVVFVSVSMMLGVTVDRLRAANQRVAQAMDGMTEAMIVYDADWRLRFYNLAGERLLHRRGIDASALRGQVVWDRVPAAVGTPLETEPRRAQQDNTVVEYETRYLDTDLWLRVRCVPTPDGGVTIFAQDITQARLAERERERTEERYRALIEASTIMVWNSDSAGMVDDVPVWRDLTGQTTEERRGSGWIDAVHPADRARVDDIWRTATARAEPYSIEYRLRRRDGKYHWFRARAVPIRDGKDVVEWVGVFDDIDDEHVNRERHEAVENALGVLGISLDYEWNLAAVTRLLVPVLADYCSVDLVDDAGNIRRVSSTHVDPLKEEVVRTLWSKYPYSPDDRGTPEVVKSGKPALNPVIDPEEIAQFARSPEHAELLRQLQPRSFLCVPMRSRGQIFGALSLVYSDSGRVYGSAEVAAVEQIATRAATAIENARLYADAQAANRAKSDFLATMSHELRTPLNAIAGYVELLTMGVRGPITDAQRRDLVRIRQNQQHLLEIITDILNFSRIEAGRMRYDIQRTLIEEVLVRMEGVIEPQARVRSIVYEHTPAPMSLVALADREKLEQVLINLLGNSVKFTAPGGRVTLTADADEHRVRIHVADTGVGIAEGQLSTIFEPFVQLEPAFTRTSEGTGLGLAISRELTRGMGGELTATSTLGQGSVFTVELPRA
ncbi:MAG: ATP-binding protein [Gemmatimonadota bacterium]